MIVNSEQFMLLLGTLSVAPTTSGPDQIRAYAWMPYGPFADQTECVKMLMMGTYKYDALKIVKMTLPLLLKPDHDTVMIDELTEHAEVCDLEDEQPTKA